MAFCCTIGQIHPHGNKATKEIPSLDEAEWVAGVNPIYLQRHRDRLCEQVVTFRTQLSPPDIETLFAAEVCRKVHNAVQNASPLLSYSWKSVEKEFLFSHLTSGRFSEFTQFGSWKGQLGHLIHTCLQLPEIAAAHLECITWVAVGKRGWRAYSPRQEILVKGIRND